MVKYRELTFAVHSGKTGITTERLTVSEAYAAAKRVVKIAQRPRLRGAAMCLRAMTLKQGRQLSRADFRRDSGNRGITIEQLTV
jgi:hypothetical protein